MVVVVVMMMMMMMMMMIMIKDYCLVADSTHFIPIESMMRKNQTEEGEDAEWTAGEAGILTAGRCFQATLEAVPLICGRCSDRG